MGKLDVDPRTDVFALAAIMHELATGEVAFAGDDVAEILSKITSEDPPPVSIVNSAYPWAFDEVVRKGLRKDKLERFGSSLELAEGILRALGLDPDVQRWARAPLGEIEKLIGRAPEMSAADAPSPFNVSIPPELPSREHRGVTLVIGFIVVAGLIVGSWLLVSS